MRQQLLRQISPDIDLEPIYTLYPYSNNYYYSRYRKDGFSVRGGIHKEYKAGDLKNYLVYTFKLYTFLKISKLLKTINLKKSFFFKIFFTYFSYIWFLFLESHEKKIYLILIKASILKYRAMYHIKKDSIYFKDNAALPANFLNFCNLSVTAELEITEKKLREASLFFNENYDYSDEKFSQPKYINVFVYEEDDYCYPGIKLNFLRVQRRYNKRRYSKVRVVSRSSFFSGISLSSIFLGLLWGGSIKSIDWLTSWIVVININLFIFIVIFYLFFRIWSLFNLNIFVRKKNKIRIINTLHKMFILNFFIFKK